MQIEGFTGRDHPGRARPPNLGIVSLRYPVRDWEGYRAALAAKGVVFVYKAEDVAIAGVGLVDIFAVRDPDSSITEFYDNGE